MTPRSRAPPRRSCSAASCCPAATSTSTAAAARRHRRRRRPDHGHRPVPGRPRPGPEVDGQGQRRQRRPGDRRSSSTATTPRSPSSCATTPSCPTTRSPRSARPACSARSSSRSPPPETGASDEPLADGDVIPLDRTGRNPEVEEVLGALSLILNGGGVAQLKTIAQELNKARRPAARTTSARCSSQIDTFTGSLDTNKAQIVDAIEALNRLALSAHQQEGNIDAGARGAAERADQHRRAARGPGPDAAGPRPAVSDVGVRVIKASKAATIDSLRQLAAGAQPAGRLRRRLRQGVQRLPDLPVRRRGRRPRPAGGPQPAHGRLHQPVDHPRRRPDPGGCLPTDPDRRAADPARPGPAGPATCSTASPAATSPARACQKVLSTARGAAQAQGALPGAGQPEQDRVRAAQHRPRPARAARRLPAGARCRRLTVRGLPSVLGVLGGLGRSGTGPWNDAAHGGPTMAPAAGGLRPVAGQPAGAPALVDGAR